MKNISVQIYYDDCYEHDYIFNAMDDLGIEIHHNSGYFLGDNSFCGDSVDYLLGLLDFTEKQIEILEKKFDSIYCNDCLEYLLNRLESKAILPVYVYEHSGSAISTSPFSCRWDSGQIGFIYVANKAKFKRAYNIKKMDNKEALRVMDSFIREIDEIWKGNVYMFDITNTDTDESICSCGGFIGDDNEIVIKDMLENVSIDGICDCDADELKKLFVEAFDNIEY